MRSRLAVAGITIYLALMVVGCSSKPAADSGVPSSTEQSAANPGAKDSGSEAKEIKPQPVVVRAGTSVTIALNSALGSKVSKPGDKFTGSVSRNISIGGAVAIPKGASVNGTVLDAKALGKLAGEAVLQIRLDSIEINGVQVPVHTATSTFSVKGKGKRTLVLTGGGAALGGLVGGLAGGGKGAAIGAAAGAGAGVGGSALTGNKEVELPAESAVTFQLSKSLEVKE